MEFPIIPEYVHVEITSKCNLYCPLCPKGRNEIRRKQVDLDVKKFESIVNKLKEHDPVFRLWNYGDPLLHTKIFQILDKINNNFNTCAINTNGLFMNEKLAERIVKCGITEIIFSIDGITQASYEKYRVGGNLNTAINSLKTVIKAKNKFQSDISITVQFLIFKHNIKELPKLENFFFPLGIDNLYAKSVILMMENEEKNLINQARKYLNLKYIGERYEIKNDKLLFKGKMLPKCPIIDNSFTITSDEDILVCCWDYQSKYKINSHEMWKKIKELVNSKDPPLMCKRCPMRNQQEVKLAWNKVPLNFKET